jgi:hypothetical protein
VLGFATLCGTLHPALPTEACSDGGSSDGGLQRSAGLSTPHCQPRRAVTEGQVMGGGNALRDSPPRTETPAVSTKHAAPVGSRGRLKGLYRIGK